MENKTTNAICSVLVSSCDKYEDAWNPFFTLFAKYWPDCEYPVFFNIEHKAYSNKTVSVNVLNTEKSCSWSKRLKSALKKINTKYVIFLLEDFFFLDFVNKDQIAEYLHVMEEDETISVIDFEHPRFKNPLAYDKCKRLCYRDLKEMYFLNCQASIWRRKDLIKFLSPYENAWQFEIFGTERAKLYPKKFLLLNEKSSSPFKYDFNCQTGYGIYRGKWLKSNINLFNENGIVVNFDRLGFVECKAVDKSIEPPEKVLFKERLMYLLFSGGDISPRLSIIDSFILLFCKPRTFCSLQKAKLIRFFSKDFYKFL